MKNVSVFLTRSKFSVKLIYCITFRSIILVFFLSMNNLIDNQLHNHLPDLYQFFECCNVFLYHFLLADQKKSQPSIMWKKIFCVFCFDCIILKSKQKEFLDSLKSWINEIVPALIHLIDTCSSLLFF